MKQQGFTIIELMVTVVIITVISSIAISSVFENLKGANLKNSINLTEQNLKIAQSLAIKKSKSIILQFNGQYLYIKDNSNNIYETIELGENISFDSSNSTIQSSMVVFDFRGRPVSYSNQDDLITESQNKITLKHNSSKSRSNSMSLVVVPLTGKVESL